MAHKSQFVVASENKAKVNAVVELLALYPHFKDATVRSARVNSDVREQPISLDETLRGAMNRARNAFNECDFSVGIESGLMEVPYTKSGYMDVCASAIYDGKEFYLGLSSAWEFPDKDIIRAIIEEGIDMSQAINNAGLTKNPQIGTEEGAIGIVTKGRIDRKEYTKQALRMSLIHLEQFN